MDKSKGTHGDLKEAFSSEYSTIVQLQIKPFLSKQEHLEMAVYEPAHTICYVCELRQPFVLYC